MKYFYVPHFSSVKSDKRKKVKIRKSCFYLFSKLLRERGPMSAQSKIIQVRRVM